MNIWELWVNEDYNNAFLIDEKGNQQYEKGFDFKEIKSDPYTRKLNIEIRKKGFPDIMNYWGIQGSCIVSAKVKRIIETCFENLRIQFIPCHSRRFSDIEMWILNVCEYHDVLDADKSNCQLTNNFKGEQVIKYVKDYAFIQEAFKFDMFKIYLNGIKRSTHLFVSDRFKTIMEENGVTGLALEKVYSI